MQYIFILFHLFNFASADTNKPYESYEEIVEKLSNRRSQTISSQLSSTVPRERFHVSLGLTSTNTRIADNNIGSLSHTGFLLGASVPLIDRELFFDAKGKFYKNAESNTYDSSLQQFEAIVNHKESMENFILNLGAGMSTRFLNVTNSQQSTGLFADDAGKRYTIPSILLVLGLERRLSTRISLAGDLGYHRSMRSDPNGKNTVELSFRLNYHL
jgi:hypothetical protein